jgi:hypothetical protein
MTKLTLAAALILSSTAFGAVHAGSAPESPASPDTQVQRAPSPNADTRQQPTSSRNADAANDSHHEKGFFRSWLSWGRHHDEDGDDAGRRHHRRGHHHWDDDDDDRGSARHSRNGRGSEANRPVDPNATNAPVPDNGVFNNKTRPKVEVQ